MNDSTDMIREILSDPDKLSSIMSIASSFLGGSQEPTQNDVNIADTDDDISQLDTDDTSTFNGKQKIDFNNIGDMFGSSDIFGEGGDILGVAMPFINNIIKDSSSSITPEKKQLIKALSPFAPNNISSQMNRSVKLIGIAKAAKSALNQFSKKG